MVTISQRQLNQTFLERQFLLERTDREPLEVISRLLALQSQAANSPYEALWNRIEGFDPRSLDQLYADRRAVRGTWFRSTVQTTTADDYLAFRGLHSELFARGMESYLGGVQGTEWLEELRGATSKAGPLTGRKLSAIASELFPDEHSALWSAHRLRRAIPMVRHPNGAGGRTLGSRDPWVEVESYLGSLPLPASRVDLPELIRRYLAAYGPASVADATNFLGLTRLAPTFKAMSLVEHSSEAGTVLYDLPEATLADPEREAPPRLMASFDHSILGHADRSRIIDPGHSKILSGVNAVFKPYILLDGRVAGHWSYALKRGAPSVTFRYFNSPTPEQESLLLAEAESWCESWFGTQQGLSFDIGEHS